MLNIVARPAGEKTRCGGRWTEAKFHSFVKNQLRQATRKWAPISDCLKAARVRRGWYLCADCKEEMPNTIRDETSRSRVKNVFVDHIEPIVPVTGWVSWDHCIDSMFSEGDNLQVMCGPCHKIKTADEAALRKIHRKAGKEK